MFGGLIVGFFMGCIATVMAMVWLFDFRLPFF